MSQSHQKPYAMLGAGELSVSLWKRGSDAEGWSYDFTVFRLDVGTGEVDQLMTPAHLTDFVKLARVLAQVIADDGCVSHTLRRKLNRLASQIDLFCGVEE